MRQNLHAQECDAEWCDHLFPDNYKLGSNRHVYEFAGVLVMENSCFDQNPNGHRLNLEAVRVSVKYWHYST